MAHTDRPDDHAPQAIGHETTDADLGMTERLIVITLVALGISAAIIWGMFHYLRAEAVANDPRPLPIAQRQGGDRVPPAPRLQTTPYRDLASFNAAEDAALNQYGWVDRERGLVRVPVARAIDLIAERGLPSWGPPGGSATPGAAGTGAAGAGAGGPGGGAAGSRPAGGSGAGAAPRRGAGAAPPAAGQGGGGAGSGAQRSGARPPR